MKHNLSAAAAIAAAIGACGGAHAAASLDVLYSFCPQQGCSDGDQPYAGLTLDSQKKLLGTTGFGGKYNGGTVFALDEKRGTWKLKNLKNFCVGTPPNCQPDQGPSVTLVLDVHGNLYGSVYFGGASGDGAVFEMEAKGNNRYALHDIHSFSGSDGQGPWDLSYAGQQTGAPYDGTSPLYGATIAGGADGSGTVYSLTPNGKTWTFQSLYSFTGGTDGGLPRGAVTADPSGALYGTTSYDGAQNAGTIYRLAQTNGHWGETTLYTFCSKSGCTDGNGPFAGLAEDASGNLYGTTYFGGGNAGDGVAFELSAGGQYSVLYTFCAQNGCSDGAEPAAQLALDAAGNLFGTTSRGGNGNYGTLFQIAPAQKYRVVYSFCSEAGCKDGGYPYGTLALGRRGHIFGTTQYGGANGLGEVYEVKQ